MPDYRLTDELGGVVETTTLDDDREALAWHASRPFRQPTVTAAEGRGLRLERLKDGTWVHLQTFGTIETN